jgi:hypothetical protein
LIRAKKLIEENQAFFCEPDTLSDTEYQLKREIFSSLAQEEEKMIEVHSMSLDHG